MSGINNGTIIKALAFEKAVLEILKRDNPNIKESYYEYEEISGVKRRYQYDAVINDRLSLESFGKESIYAEKIVVEIKAGRVPIEIFRRFIIRTEDKFDAIVFILAVSKSYKIDQKLNSDAGCILYIKRI